ncbi:hypothetical protein HHI36_006140 [Cryptolaemus montrouzieri]|uniref:Uncharacterized protein n=1 Tax=Cryptolaemus montrouzieri TaxID=559131 RepID=A0ABD2NW74_9CUCU
MFYFKKRKSCCTLILKLLNSKTAEVSNSENATCATRTAREMHFSENQTGNAIANLIPGKVLSLNFERLNTLLESADSTSATRSKKVTSIKHNHINLGISVLKLPIVKGIFTRGSQIFHLNLRAENYWTKMLSYQCWREKLNVNAG